MYPVTQDFLDKMKATERRVIAKVQIDYTDPFIDQSIQCSANEQANVSYPAQTADAVTEPFAKYAALDGLWVLGEDWALAPGPDEAATKQMGWWGSQLSRADGSFTTPYPTLKVTFFERPITQLKVVGDSKRGEYPIDFDINLYDANGTILYTETVTGNTQITWQKTLANPITQVTKMDLVVKKWSHSGRQVKILEFFTSIQKVYEGDDILLIHLLEEREVSQGSLPVGNISANEIDIRLNNSTRKFDAGNKQSPLYQLLKQNRRIKAWLGLKGDGDGVNVQQTVDFSQGTLNNLVVVNNKLQLSSVAAPSFTRNSIAYKNDGTLVNTNLPRFEQGKFGQAVMVEEGTTNLVSNSSFESGMWPELWSPQNGTATLVTGWNGSGNAVRITITKEDNTFGIVSARNMSLSEGVKYTISFRARAIRDNFPVSYMHLMSSSVGNSNLPTINIGTTWKRYTITYTIPAGKTASDYGLMIAIDSRLGDVYANDWIEVDDVQIEAKPYATSFIDGTRSPEILTIPTAGVLNPQEGTVECWVYVDSLIKNTAANRYIFAHGTSSGPPYPNRLSLMHNINNEWALSSSNGAGQSSNVVVLDALSMGWHYFSVRWSPSELALFIDGVKVGYVTNPYLPETLANSIYIGCWVGGTYGWCNSLIDDLRISSRARTDEEIAAAYASGQPLPVDEWTTYKLNFDGNLNFGQGGYYLSPEYDLSAVGTAATSAISWQEDPDGIQRLVYAKLDNQADWTQVQNGGKLPINVGDLLTGRKLQLKAKLLKVV